MSRSYRLGAFVCCPMMGSVCGGSVVGINGLAVMLVCGMVSVKFPRTRMFLCCRTSIFCLSEFPLQYKMMYILLRFFTIITATSSLEISNSFAFIGRKTVNRKVQGMPQSQTASRNPTAISTRTRSFTHASIYIYQTDESLNYHSVQRQSQCIFNDNVRIMSLCCIRYVFGTASANSNIRLVWKIGNNLVSIGL